MCPPMNFNTLALGRALAKMNTKQPAPPTFTGLLGPSLPNRDLLAKALVKNSTKQPAPPTFTGLLGPSLPNRGLLSKALVEMNIKQYVVYWHFDEYNTTVYVGRGKDGRSKISLQEQRKEQRNDLLKENRFAGYYTIGESILLESAMLNCLGIKSDGGLLKGNHRYELTNREVQARLQSHSKGFQGIINELPAHFNF